MPPLAGQIATMVVTATYGTPQKFRIALHKALLRPWTKIWGYKNVSNNTLQWMADEPDPQRGYCGHQARARVGSTPFPQRQLRVPCSLPP